MSSPAPDYRSDAPNVNPVRPGNGSAGRPHGTQADDHSVGGLLRQLGRDVPDLVIKEVALARAEIGENLSRTKAGIASMASGGGVLLAGLVVLLMSAVYGLSNVIEPWLAALIVGGLVTLIGFGMISAGKKRLEPDALRPDRTMHQLHRDSQAIKGRVT